MIDKEYINKYFCCDSTMLKTYLFRICGLNYICRGRNYYNTDTVEYLFEKTEEFKIAICKYDEYKLDKVQMTLDQLIDKYRVKLERNDFNNGKKDSL